MKVNARLRSIRERLTSCKQVIWPEQNIDPDRWGIFLMDVEGVNSSVYMMKFGAYIPILGMPFPHDPRTFPKMSDWQLAAALPVIYGFVKEGKVLGPFPGHTRFFPVTGHPLFFYPAFVVPKSTVGIYRLVLNASHNREGPSINDRIFDFSTTLVDFKTSL